MFLKHFENVKDCVENYIWEIDMRIHLTVGVGNTLFRYGIRGDKYFCIIKLDYCALWKYTRDIFVSYHAATVSLRLYTQKTTTHTFIEKNTTDLW